MAPIRRLLVANRGEISRRVFRTCRQMGISTAAVYAEPDRAAPYVSEADVAVALGGHTAAETYLAIDRLVAAAGRAGADAVHPGYGFLAERADFARAVIEAGLIWVGPPPETIAAMGDKLAAKDLVARAGVPTLPSRALTEGSPEEIERAVAVVGWPVLVKAAGGGGGRGMRIVREAAGLADAVASARREAAAAFGDDRVFLERYLESPRHVEVQLLGDRHGGLIHLFERECSVQRRHQKIIEESPSPAVDAALRVRLTEAAIAAGRAVGYSSAGTVEFLLDAGGAFYFLEMNTRIQVEHAVTEAVTGVDLVREQIRIAEGHALDLRPEALALRGHAIEARLYAEDPANAFLPTHGRLLDWRPPVDADLRVDSGVEAGSVIAAAFDAMLAKVVAWAPTRAEAARRLAVALEHLVAPGPVTNRDFLVGVLRHRAFLAGETATDFIERHRPAPAREPSARELAEAALAAALLAQAARRAAAPVLHTIASGWRNNPSGFQEVTYRAGTREVAIGYLRQRDGTFSCTLDGTPACARIAVAEPPLLDLELDGVRRAYRVTSGHDGMVFVQDARGEVRLEEVPRFPEPAAASAEVGAYSAPMPGKVLDVQVAAGDSVATGQVLLTIEAMKMEHRLIASTAGVVAEIRVAAGQQVAAGQVLVVISAADPPDGACRPGETRHDP